MGYITRRLTYQSGPRRFSLPATFLQAHRLEAGAELVVAAAGPNTRLVYTPAQWSALEATVRSVPLPALAALVTTGERVSLGSQARVVLPRALSFEGAEERLELSWTVDGGVLVVSPSTADGESTRSSPQPTTPDAEAASDPTFSAGEAGAPPPRDPGPPGRPAGHAPEAVSRPRPAKTATDGRTALPPRARAPQPDRRPDGLVLPGPVVDIPLEAIHGIDPDLEPEEYDPDLAEDIAAQGFLRPVVLAGPVPHRVIDGRRRLKVAQALKFETVPAIVLSAIGREDLARLRYLLETTSDRWTVARQLRVLTRLHLNGASLEALARLLRKKKRTIQRYLRIAQDPQLIDAIERGEVSLVEAERRAGPPAGAGDD